VWLAIVARPDAGDAIDRFSRVLPASTTPAIHLDATIADVTIAGSNRTDVRVDVERHAPTAADLIRFPVAVDALADGIHVSVLQDRDGRDPALRSTISIAAPAGVRLDAIRVFEGRVRLANVHASCDVDVRRGAIDASDLAGRVRLEAGIGSLDVRDSELTAGGMMRLRVFNGPLRVRFARPPASARILALTLNGSISSDIPLTMKDRVGPRFGESTLGSGDPVLSMDVVKGDISVTVEKR
jgi:hypothetical protein